MSWGEMIYKIIWDERWKITWESWEDIYDEIIWGKKDK